MPLTLHWIEKNHILEYRFEGRVTADDLKEAIQAESDFYDTTDNTIHVLMDLTAMIGMPPNAFIYTQNSALVRHPRRGWIAYVDAPVGVKVVVEVLARVNQRRRNLFLDTREAALDELHAIMAEEDATVPQPS